MSGYSRILQSFRSEAWMLEVSKYQAILGFLELKADGGTVDPAILAVIQAESTAATVRADSFSSRNAGGSVCVLPLYGVISQRASMLSSISGPGGTSLDKFMSQFRQAASDSNVKAIVIDVDSPGGSVSGCDEASAEIYKARSKKPITAVSNCQMNSAAYYIASSASEIVVSPSSLTGSIGVFSSHTDISKALEMEGVKETLIYAGRFKTELDSTRPLTDEARAGAQQMVDSFYTQFVNAVARNRGTTAAAVRGGYGEARTVTAQQAVRVGLADRVGTFDDVLAKYGISRGANGRPIGASSDRYALTEAKAKKQQDYMEANFGSRRDRGHGFGF